MLYVYCIDFTIWCLVGIANALTHIKFYIIPMMEYSSQKLSTNFKNETRKKQKIASALHSMSYEIHETFIFPSHIFVANVIQWHFLTYASQRVWKTNKQQNEKQYLSFKYRTYWLNASVQYRKLYFTTLCEIHLHATSIWCGFLKEGKCVWH